MDFLEDLFDLGDRKRRNKGGFFQNGDHHDDDHDDHDDHNQHQQYPANSYQQGPVNSQFPANQQFNSNTGFSSLGVICRKCSTQTIQGAKFCHGCGSTIDAMQNCGSCGSKLPPNAPFCPQCGFKN